MIKVLRIGHATFETPDLAKAIEHYTQVIGLSLAGREDKRAFLATRIGQLAIELQQGSEARCGKLSFEVAANADFADIRRALQKHGVAAEERNDSVPGLPKVLSFQDPKGTRIELFREWSMIGNHEQVVGVGALKLGHVAFVTPEPKAMAEVLRQGAGLPRLRLDRRLLRVHALQRRPPCGEFHRRQEHQDASHRLSSCGISRTCKPRAICSANGRSRSSGVRCGSAPATTSRRSIATTTTGWSSSTPSSTR